jgi:hypothetical protein
MVTINVDYDQADWGAQKQFADGALSGLWVPDKWIMHWGGNASLGATVPLSVEKAMQALRIYEQSHLSRGWRAIGYNYAVDQLGNSYRLRGENPSGATSGDYEPDGIRENAEGRAILWIGGKGQTPTPAAKVAARKLIEQDPKLLISHSDVKGNTECPGDDWRRYTASFILEEDVVDALKQIRDRWSPEDIEDIFEAQIGGGDPSYMISILNDPTRQDELDDMTCSILGDAVTRLADVILKAPDVGSDLNDELDAIGIGIDIAQSTANDARQTATAALQNVGDLRATLRSV